VQKLSSDQPLALIAANSIKPRERTKNTGAAQSHTYFSQTRFSQTRVSLNQGTQGSRLQKTRENHYTREKFRMECVGKTLLRLPPRPAQRGNSILTSQSLELAKGFEPPTL
jgi:hypothetical protein